MPAVLKMESAGALRRPAVCLKLVRECRAALARSLCAAVAGLQRLLRLSTSSLGFPEVPRVLTLGSVAERVARSPFCWYMQPLWRPSLALARMAGTALSWI